MLAGIAGVCALIFVISYYSKDLPDYSQLKDYKPPVVTRAYAGDGRLLAEFAQEKRIFVPIEEMPDLVKQAFISAEDQNFYEHEGVDFMAVAGAAVSNLRGQSLRGASTITQQVAKNFLLTNERTYTRKIREAILAMRMERAMSKDRLLELYLNQIYMGQRAYGVAAAGLIYFNKSLEELEIQEIAYLAALPKAPNNYHPVRHAAAAIERRDWVIDRMTEEGYITESQAELAKLKPLIGDLQDATAAVDAPYFAEEVRRELIKRYGDESLYGGGLVVRTSVDPKLQRIAERVLREGLVDYDRRHGYRGALTNWDSTDNWQEKIKEYPAPASMLSDWLLAVVLDVNADEATIGLQDGRRETLKREYLTWAKSGVTSVRDVLRTGDVIMTDLVTLEDGSKVWGLRQIPELNGAIVVIDPHTGRILAMQGGWSFNESEFNRVTQAKRQPGSAFKPFVYLTALEKGFTPATLVLDAPFVIDQGPGLAKWRPQNYSNEYYGPTPIRVGIEKSRNLMTVRLADYVGMEAISEISRRFGVIENLPPLLANSLGSGETTLLEITTGYAQLLNGGKKLKPTMIDRIQDRRGQTIFTYDQRPCQHCGGEGKELVEWNEQAVPQIPDVREQLADPRMTYQIVSILEGVVERGTGVRIRELNRPLGGKTGTTNDSKDAWFIGFSPDLVVGVYTGFDEPRTLGRKETGSSVAVPIFKAFMEEALKDTPAIPFRIPPGIKQVLIDANDGTRAQPGDEKVIWEAFLPGTEPTDKVYILDGNGISLMPSAGGMSGGEVDYNRPIVGTGGLY